MDAGGNGKSSDKWPKRRSLLTTAIEQVLTCGYLFQILYGLRFGIGLHTKDDSLPNMIELLKVPPKFNFTRLL